MTKPHQTFKDRYHQLRQAGVRRILSLSQVSLRRWLLPHTRQKWLQGILLFISLLILLILGGLGVKTSLRAAGFNILKFNIFVPMLGGVVGEEHPYRFEDILNNIVSWFFI